MRGIWRCRACGTYNDFDGIEEYLYARCQPAGDVVALGRYECAACDLAVEVAPFWFITSPDEKPAFIESAFERVEVPA